MEQVERPGRAAHRRSRRRGHAPRRSRWPAPRPGPGHRPRGRRAGRRGRGRRRPGTAYPSAAACRREADRLVVRRAAARTAAPTRAWAPSAPTPRSTSSTAHRASSPLGVRPAPAPTSSWTRASTRSPEPDSAARTTAADRQVRLGQARAGRPSWRVPAAAAVASCLGEAGQTVGGHASRDRGDPAGAPPPDDPHLVGAQAQRGTADEHGVAGVDPPPQGVRAHRQPHRGGQHQRVAGDDGQHLLVAADGEVDRGVEPGEHDGAPYRAGHHLGRERRGSTEQRLLRRRWRHGWRPRLGATAPGRRGPRRDVRGCPRPTLIPPVQSRAWVKVPRIRPGFRRDLPADAAVGTRPAFAATDPATARGVRRPRARD